jgi:hypothetical protein
MRRTGAVEPVFELQPLAAVDARDLLEDALNSVASWSCSIVVRNCRSSLVSLPVLRPHLRGGRAEDASNCVAHYAA